MLYRRLYNSQNTIPRSTRTRKRLTPLLCSRILQLYDEIASLRKFSVIMMCVRGESK